MKDVIYIEKYTTELVGNTIRYYAVKGKNKYPMPEAYKDMYDDDHLAIMKRTLERPELFDCPEGEHYIPLYVKVKA